jgi:hypothetical protein
MAAKQQINSVGEGFSRRSFSRFGLPGIGLICLGTAASLALAQAPRARVDWEKLSPEQQTAIKAEVVQAKSVNAPSQQYYFYRDGQRHPVEMTGEGAQAIFRVEGLGTNLRYSGRGEIKLSSAKSSADLKAILEPRGLQLGTSLDSFGMVWTILSPNGLSGLKALNELKESGLVIDATPDWRRELKKK